MRVRSKGVTAAGSRGAVALMAVIAVASAALAMPAAGQSNTEKPVGSEVGVTPTEIHIALIADVDNPIAPNVALSVENAVNAFAKYVNNSCASRDKCLAGRRLMVDFYDSRLNPNETRNAEIAACNNDLAMVGTFALVMETVDDMRNCPDHAGRTTGLPEIPVLPVPVVQQCSNQSFSIFGIGLQCETKNEHPQTYYADVARGFYYMKKYGNLHGLYLVTGSEATGRVDQLSSQAALRDIGGHDRGIRSDGDPTVPNYFGQTTFTPIIQTIKSNHSNYAQCTLPDLCTVLLRQEASLQGINDQVKVWDCNEQCYTTAFLHDGGAAVEDEYVDLKVLPVFDRREQKANPMLATFVRSTGTSHVDALGAEGWATALAFRDAVNATVKSHGVNGLTRANLLAALNNIHNFDADGMIARVDLASRRPSECHILTQVRNGKFVRVEPTKPGKFDCNAKYVITRKVDLLAGS